MTRVLFIVVCFATLVSACSVPRNDEHASAIRGRTYEETLTIELPRIEGVIDGAEIPVRSGYLPYAGRIVITDRKMKVDLYYNGDGGTKVALLWNGEYMLLQRGINGVP
jgi:hypothetical protein